MNTAFEFLKGALLLMVWPTLVYESWDTIPTSERDDFAGALNWVALITAALVWVTYYVDTLWLKVPFLLLALAFHLCCGMFFALAVLIVNTPEYEDY